MSAACVTVSTVSSQGTGRGSIPTAALQLLVVKPVPFVAAKALLVKHHYLHSMPGGTRLAFGVLKDDRLLGALTFGAGPANAYRLVANAAPDDCLTLSRLWLSDELPANSESRVMGIALSALKKHTDFKFIVSYADPSQGHLGTIYQATGWTYTGLSEAMPMFDLGDGRVRHSRSLSHSLGSHSIRYFEEQGLEVKVVPQSRKHRYIYFLDLNCRDQLTVPVYPYPKKEQI
ncbi:DNA methyltransferase [Dehalogenimonas alkenigignens]|uniref:Mom family adenine methylcarbamoylation protein n=1 Tax=Dehalogenimonas alkenigignens TaxID=1217799 RepID=UPI000D57744C|nr:DNA methyltransferase [Dehalogenimonas alkenigignens]PVV82559.1 DNA methyltransferase [Dehalogenimonas alkenigignens]